MIDYLGVDYVFRERIPAKGLRKFVHACSWNEARNNKQLKSRALYKIRINIDFVF